jgi:hypothetical protein
MPEKGVDRAIEIARCPALPPSACETGSNGSIHRGSFESSRRRASRFVGKPSHSSSRLESVEDGIPQLDT